MRDINKYKTFLFLLFLTFLLGCGSDQVITKIDISPSSAYVALNATKQFYAYPYSSSTYLSGQAVTWAADSNIGTIDASGLFYAGGSSATGNITVSSGDISSTATIKVTDKGNVSGRVIDEVGANVSGLSVYLLGEGVISDATDSSGNYFIEGGSFGTHEIYTGETILYISSSSEIFVQTAESVTANFTVYNRLAIQNESLQTSSGVISISGTVYNRGTTTAEGVAVTYTFYDEFGNTVTSGIAQVGNISPLASASFSISAFLGDSTYTSYKKVASTTGF